MKIPAVIVMRPHFAVKVIQKLRWCLSCFCHEVQKVKAGKYGIPLRDMPSEAIAAAFFPTNDGLLLHHQGSNIFETHLSFINRHVEKLPQARKHHGGSEGPHHGTTFTTTSGGIETKQGNNLMLR